MAEQKDKMDYEFTWLEDFDHDALVVESVDSFVHLRVLASADFLDDFVVVLSSKRNTT